MNVRFQFDNTTPAFLNLDDATRQEGETLAADFNAFNDAIVTNPTKAIGSQGIACVDRLSTYLDKLDERQATAIEAAKAEVVAAEDAANAGLIAAGFCDANTLWMVADKLGLCPAVAAARENLLRFSEWTTRGVRAASEAAKQRIDNLYGTLPN